MWAFTALPLPSQVTANTLPCSGNPLPAPGHVAILHLEGFKTCAKHGPSRHKIRLWAFTALPLPSQVTATHVALQRQPFASAWPCRHTPCRALPLLQNGHREARCPCSDTKPVCASLLVHAAISPGHSHTRCPLAAVSATCASALAISRHIIPVWAFTALPLPSPGHRDTRCPAAAALCQRLATLPYRHTPLHPFRGFHNLREARAIRTQNPSCGPLPLCHCLPRSPHTRCPAAAALCQRLAMSPYSI